MLVEIDLKDALAAGELLALQRAAYRQEAELINYPNLPPLLETLPDLLDGGDSVLGWRVDGELLGAISYQVQADQLDICKLVVDPAAQRQGIGRRLVHALQQQSAGRSLTVSTALANTPACQLYRQLGFVESRLQTLDDGLQLQHFVWAADESGVA